MSAAILVQFSSLELPRYLKVGRKALDRSLSERADDGGHEPPLHHMLCIAAMKSPDLKPSAEACRPYMNLFHAGFVVIAEDYDWAEILEAASMPSIMTETIERGYSVGFIAGTLSQWRDAMLRGCQPEIMRGVREAFNSVYTEFKNIGLSHLFEFKTKPNPRDHTFLLEYKK